MPYVAASGLKFQQTAYADSGHVNPTARPRGLSVGPASPSCSIRGSSPPSLLEINRVFSSASDSSLVTAHKYLNSWAMEREWRLDMYKDTVTWVGGIYQAPDKDVGRSFF
jgi:hypothetical protein